MKIFSFLLLILLAGVTSAHAQITQEEIAQTGFRYYSIEDTSGIAVSDSLRFIVSTPINEKKPLVLFIQGSGPIALFYNGSKGYFCSVSSLFPPDFTKKYHVVVIAKPGLPISFDYKKSHHILDNKEVSRIFYEGDNKDYFVRTSAEVLRYLSKMSWVDPNKIYVVGHSQGYTVAAEMARKYPRLISKVVCMSSNPFDRHSVYIYGLKKEEREGKISSQQMQEKLDSIYQREQKLVEWYNKRNSYPKNEGYWWNYAEYTFNCEPPLNDLLQTKIPVLIVYGTNDNASALNDYVPLFFARTNKHNLTMMRLPGMDHNYFSKPPASSNDQKTEPTFNWPKVMTKVEKWLSK